MLIDVSEPNLIVSIEINLPLELPYDTFKRALYRGCSRAQNVNVDANEKPHSNCLITITI